MVVGGCSAGSSEFDPQGLGWGGGVGEIKEPQSFQEQGEELRDVVSWI